jgi:peptidoglycan LD-endopeptidase LytH
MDRGKGHAMPEPEPRDVVDGSRMRRHHGSLPALVMLAIAATSGCDRVQELGARIFDQPTARERYEARLESVGLDASAVGRDWIDAAKRAFDEASDVTMPWKEEGYLSPAEPSAIAWKLSLRRGQRVDVSIDVATDTTAALFIDIWRVDGDTARSYRWMASADSGARSLHFEPRSDADYIVRVQPELLRGGHFTATLASGPTLSFPVEGARDADIGSVFGDPRDGGARDHHGIDIFAQRGTPALAAAPARVSRVEVTPIGGKVVWLRDRQGRSLYYAHLDSQVVSAGSRVEPGDTVGFIGNTGNARTTPPHLHFGVYSRGPVNPYWFVHRTTGSPPRLVADTARLGEWVRITRSNTSLLQSPATNADRRTGLAEHTAMRVVGAAGEWYRVLLPDGVTGWVRAGRTESAERAVDIVAIASPVAITPKPDDDSGWITTLPAGERVPVYGRFGDRFLVRTPGGRAGWVALHP